MKLTYNVEDKPSFGKVLVFALQQLLAIMAATITVPAIINNGIEGANMSPAAALFGAGVGTFVYLCFTKFKSPVFLGSSFAFIGSMFAAFAGGVSMALGYAGLIIGACLAGLVYVVLAIVVKCAGTAWINKLMPAAVIGPTVAIIGLSLGTNAVHDMMGVADYDLALKYVEFGPQNLYRLIVGLVTLAVTMVCSVYGKKNGMIKMIPFVIGIGAGYLVALAFTLLGGNNGVEGMNIINLSAFADMKLFQLPEFTFLSAFGGVKELNWGYVATIAVAYVPVAFVVFAEHLADHKNISSIIERDLIKDPGLHRTLLGDGVGSMAGAFFGGCPNTTYGESIATVAISSNASIVTILTAAIMAVAVSFFGPFATFLASIPGCVMGGVCVALYGFIAVSGLKMIQKIDLNDNRNLFVVSVILIAGVGGLALNFVLGNGQAILLTSAACSLILGILVNLLLSINRKKKWYEYRTTVLDKDYTELSGPELMNTPVAALKGVSESDAEKLKEAFNIRTIGDLANNKYFRHALEMSNWNDGNIPKNK